jgi:membrane protein DedA with SNARE-associated domain
VLPLKTSLSPLLLWAGHAPLLQAVAVIAGTFVLEDATTVGTAMAVQDGRLALPTGLLALYAGIVLGDLGLYGLGRLASMVPWAQRLIPPPRAKQGRTWLEQHVFRTVFVARFMPGVRLPTYTACGFLHASLARFALAAGGATLIWTSLLFGVSLRVGKLLMDHLGAWRWAGAIGFVLAVVLAGRLGARAVAERE